MAQRCPTFFFWSDVNVLMLGVGPFLSDASQWQLMLPANAALFAHSVLGAPLVVSCEVGRGVIAVFPRLLESRDDCLEKMGSCVDLCQAGFEFLDARGPHV
jgi:hypothetical protein